MSMMDTWPLSDTDDFQGGIMPDNGNIDFASLDPNQVGTTPQSNAGRGGSGVDNGTVHLAWLIVAGSLIALVALHYGFRGALQ